MQMNVNGHRIAMDWRRDGVLLLVNGINMGHFTSEKEAVRWCVALAELAATGPAQLQPEALVLYGADGGEERLRVCDLEQREGGTLEVQW